MAFTSVGMSHNFPSVFESLVDSGVVANVFSMCFGDEDGALVLGGIEPSYYTGQIVYTPIVVDTYYMVDLLGITIESETTPMNYYPTIVDSGTTLMIVP